jgi:hypothetical protein
LCLKGSIHRVNAGIIYLCRRWSTDQTFERTSFRFKLPILIGLRNPRCIRTNRVLLQIVIPRSMHKTIPPKDREQGIRDLVDSSSSHGPETVRENRSTDGYFSRCEVCDLHCCMGFDFPAEIGIGSHSETLVGVDVEKYGPNAFAKFQLSSLPLMQPSFRQSSIGSNLCNYWPIGRHFNCRRGAHPQLLW